jgi:hypothetical protein
MGHSSIQVTVDLYGHLIPGGKKQAVDRLDYPAETSLFEAHSATKTIRPGSRIVRSNQLSSSYGEKGWGE